LLPRRRMPPYRWRSTSGSKAARSHRSMAFSRLLLELLPELELLELELPELELLELELLELLPGLLELGASVPPQAVSMETAMTAANATAAIFLDNLILMFLLFLV
jgi:hypothetical protein